MGGIAGLKLQLAHASTQSRVIGLCGNEATSLRILNENNQNFMSNMKDMFYREILSY